MSHKTCAILATPPGFKTGMVAVELGLQAFVKRHSLSATIETRRLCSVESRLAGLPPAQRATDLRRAGIGLACSVLQSVEELDGFDTLLFWGDFLHKKQYLLEFSSVIADTNPSLFASCRGDISRVLLLHDAPTSRLQKAVSVSTTLLFNGARDAVDGAYQPKLKRFARGARRIWVRDVYSAANVARATEDYATPFWGPDCAQIACAARPLPSGAPERKQACVFFGRTEEQAVGRGNFVAKLAAARDLELIWLDTRAWGGAAAHRGLVLGESVDRVASFHRDRTVYA